MNHASKNCHSFCHLQNIVIGSGTAVNDNLITYREVRMNIEQAKCTKQVIEDRYVPDVAYSTKHLNVTER